MPKEQEPIKIDVEDLADEPVRAETINISDELRNLGRQFAETMQTAWNSEERQRIESEFRQGIANFSEEINRVVNDVNSSPAAQRVREEAAKVDSTDTAQKAKSAVAQGLHWLSSELAKLSDRLNTDDNNEKSA